MRTIRLRWGVISLLTIPAIASAQWVETQFSLVSPIIRPNAIASSGSMLLVGTDSMGVFLTTDGGANWEVANFGLQGVTIFSLTNVDSTVFAGTEVTICRFRPETRSWVPANTGLTYSPFFALIADSSTLYCGMSGALYTSTDRGGVWTRLYGYAPEYGLVHSIAARKADLLVGTAGHGIRASADGGVLWYAQNSGLPSGADVLSVLIMGDLYFAGTWGSGLYLSRDAGRNWSLPEQGPPEGETVYTIRDIGGMLLIGTASGVYASTDSGGTWGAFNEGLPAFRMTVALHPLNDWLYAGMYDGSVRKRPLDEVTFVKENKEYPSVPALFNAYPNPFNASTVIRYALPRSSEIGLTVVDLLGREVAVIFHGVQEAGGHEARFDAAGLASGVYFCRLQAGEFMKTTSVVLVR